MSGLPDEIYQSHEILKRYIIIHDKIFKFSWRKAIPIPGLFKPINYGQHAVDLDFLASALEEIITKVDTKADVPDVFVQYIAALLNTIRFLCHMCNRLYNKSQGDLRSYTLDQYNSDMAIYERLVDNYRSLGTVLNQNIYVESS